MNTKLIFSLRLLLAIYFIIGASYMLQNYTALASDWATNTVSPTAWLGLGILQIILAVGLILPRQIKIIPHQVLISALGLVAISLAGSFLYVAYSGLIGMLWSLVPAALLMFVAFRK